MKAGEGEPLVLGFSSRSFAVECWMGAAILMLR